MIIIAFYFSIHVMTNYSTNVMLYLMILLWSITGSASQCSTSGDRAPRTCLPPATARASATQGTPHDESTAAHHRARPAVTRASATLEAVRRHRFGAFFHKAYD